MSNGTYIVTLVTDGNETPRVFRIEENDEGVNDLALRLEALVEADYLEDFTIEGQNLPERATAHSLYTAIAEAYMPSEWETLSGVWERGWKNRDGYFSRNALRRIRG